MDLVAIFGSADKDKSSSLPSPPTFVDSHFVNSHFVNIDQMEIDKVGSYPEITKKKNSQWVCNFTRAQPMIWRTTGTQEDRMK